MHMRCINERDRSSNPALVVLVFKSVTQNENRTYIERLLSSTEIKQGRQETSYSFKQEVREGPERVRCERRAGLWTQGKRHWGT